MRSHTADVTINKFFIFIRHKAAKRRLRSSRYSCRMHHATESLNSIVFKMTCAPLCGFHARNSVDIQLSILDAHAWSSIWTQLGKKHTEYSPILHGKQRIRTGCFFWLNQPNMVSTSRSKWDDFHKEEPLVLS